ncbi:MAG: glycosyltransferase [Microgenomates group bacterium]|jgi:glycosyltransferase involved in cell wall biosynthesis
MELLNFIPNKAFSFLSINPKKDPFKVLFISHTANLAGAEKSLLNLISNLKKRGVICQVVLPHQGLLENKLTQIGVKYTLIPYEWWAHDPKNPIKIQPHVSAANNQAVIEIANQINKFNPDIVYTNTIVIPWGALAAKLTGKPHIWSIREFTNKPHSLKCDLGFKQTLKIIDDLSAAVFVNSKAVQKEICKIIPQSKVSLFYNYITLDRKTISKKVAINSSVYKLIIVGSILPNKGQLEAVKALKYIDNNSVHLSIVGPAINNNYLKKIENFIKNNNLQDKVTILDFTDNPYSLIKKSNATLVCSKNEAFGRTVVESMLLKRVVIGTKSGGIIEQIKNGQNGFLYTSGKPQELSEKITYLIDHPKIAKKIALQGYQGVRKNFTEQKCKMIKLTECIRLARID